MKRLIIIALVLGCIQAKAQQIVGSVVDAITNKPLGYANVFTNFKNRLQYTDSIGYFTLNKDSLDKKDSIYIQYVGYKTLAFAAASLGYTNIFKMAPQSQELEPVVVTNCRRFKEYTINRRLGKIKDYIGPGPETRFVIMGRYLAGSEVDGFIKKLEIYAGNFNANIHVPVRLHWYNWDSAANVPGNELTTANIVIYPYRQGWNSFALPANTIYFSGGGIVIGLEFIYPVEYMRQYNLLPTTDSKAAWLMDMNNRWSLGMQLTKDASQAGFYQVNNLAVRKYNSRGRDLFIKPALRFTVAKCLD